jgi:hypothetical protein
MKLFLSTPALKSEALYYTFISYLLRQGGKPLNNIQDNKELMPRLHINLYTGGDST